MTRSNASARAAGARCIVCEGPLPSLGSRVSPRKYCSDECLNVARRAKYADNPRPRKPRPSLEDRLWSRVDKRPSGCWEWQGHRMAFGYGQIGIDGQGHTMTTHRVAWFLTYGDPGFMHVLHKCDNPPCVNPEHLFLGTNADNTADKVNKGRQYRPPRKAVSS